MLLAIRACLLRLEGAPEDAWEAARSLAGAREAFGMLKASEARHVSRALRDPTFRFAAAQAELAALRGRFSGLVGALAGNDAFGLEARSELRTMALLAERAPLTTEAELASIRSRRRARVAVASG